MRQDCIRDLDYFKANAIWHQAAHDMIGDMGPRGPAFPVFFFLLCTRVCTLRTYTRTHTHAHTHTHTHTHKHKRTHVPDMRDASAAQGGRRKVQAAHVYRYICIITTRTEFSYYRMCSRSEFPTTECVLCVYIYIIITWTEFSYYRMCSLTAKCVCLQMCFLTAQHGRRGG